MADTDKAAVLPVASQFSDIGFDIVATAGTASFFKSRGIPSRIINKVSMGRPHAVDLIKNSAIDLVINTGSGQSFASQFFIPNILADTFDRGYSLRNANKDMAHTNEISTHYKIPLPVVTAAMKTYRKALSLGLGEEDKGAMIKVFEKELGVAFRRKGK